MLWLWHLPLVSGLEISTVGLLASRGVWVEPSLDLSTTLISSRPDTGRSSISSVTHSYKHCFSKGTTDSGVGCDYDQPQRNFKICVQVLRNQASQVNQPTKTVTLQPHEQCCLTHYKTCVHAQKYNRYMRWDQANTIKKLFLYMYNFHFLMKVFVNPIYNHHIQMIVSENKTELTKTKFILKRFCKY